MSTHSIGSDTCNFPVNMPVDERMVWGRLAFMNGRSIGAEIRRLALAGLKHESPVTAAQIEQIRRTRKQRLAAIVCLCASLITFWVSMQPGDHDKLRRSSGKVKTVRVIPAQGLVMELACEPTAFPQ